MAPYEEPYEFSPEGLQVLVVDANPVCLSYLVFLLKKCKYRVVGVRDGTEALDELRGNKGNFDIVITNVEQQDIDGFKLLEIIGHELDIPVIIISADDSQANVLRGIEHGAMDYILKPVRVQQIKNIWQHVFRKKMSAYCQKSDATKETNEPKEVLPVCSSSSSSASKKKRRITWTLQLHRKFVEAVEKLGNVAHPKKVLELMNEPGLTRDNVASHLQKFRNVSRKQIDSHDLRSNCFGPIVRGQEKVNRTIKTAVEETKDYLRPTELLQFQDLDFAAYVKKIQLPDEYMRHTNLGFNGYGSRTMGFYARPSVFTPNPYSQASMINESSSETLSISDIWTYQNPLPGQQETRETLIDARIETLIRGENSGYQKATLLSYNSMNQQPSGLQNLETSTLCPSSDDLFDDDLHAIIKPFIDSETPGM